MNKFFPFYFHFYSKKNDPRLWPQIVFCPNFVFCVK